MSIIQIYSDFIQLKEEENARLHAKKKELSMSFQIGRMQMEIASLVMRYINQHGENEFNDVASVKFISNNLLSKRICSWEDFAGHFGLGSIDHLNYIENACRLEGTHNVMKIIIEQCERKPTWGDVLNILLQMEKFNVLVELLSMLPGTFPGNLNEENSSQSRSSSPMDID